VKQAAKMCWHGSQLVKPINIVNYSTNFAYKFSVSNCVTSFFHRAANPYAGIYFDQQNSNAALQLVFVRAM
jgi:hypothetical protein